MANRHGRRLIVGWNDLATVEPVLAVQLVDESVGRQVTRGSGESALWFCEGTEEKPHPRHEWSARVSSRVGGNGCGACSGKVVIVGWNDLATVEPELAAQLVDPSIAKTVTRSSNKSVRWFCEGISERSHPRHEWSATSNRRSTGSGCPACAGLTVIVGWNDLATVEPELAAQLVDPSIAKTVTRSSHKPVRWFCEGISEQPHPRHEWTAAIKHRSNGTGCPVCALFGFDPSKPSWLYFLRHDGWDMQQIGITNNPDNRIRIHERSGWRIVEIRKYDDGGLCQADERAALAALRLRGARVGRSGDPTDLRFDGYTEAWPITSLEASSLQQLLEWVRDDEWD